ncbi:MAG TPA: phosphoribosyltransferase family protein [Longimicrobiales bacterium]|nr:phosphoribosyltransferase family protein [Longimicrobiales bacterium]
MATFRLPGDPDPDPRQYLEVGWEFFGELCRGLAMRAAREFDPDLVVGIARTGVIPAGVVASVLRSELYTMTITRHESEGAHRERPRIFSEAPTRAAGRSVLIVDEVTSSGDTLRMAIAALRDVGAAEISTATCFKRTNGYEPDLYALETDDTLIFPWDRKIVIDDDLAVNPLYEGVVEE